MVSKMRHLRPSSEIRQAFQYNNQHYVALSNIITKLTGIPYIDYVKQHIFDPLGMNSTTYNVTEAKLRGDRTDGYMRAGRNQTRCAEAASLNRPSMRFGSTFA